MNQGIGVIQRIVTLDIRRSLLSTEPKPAHQTIGNQTTFPVSKQLDGSHSKKHFMLICRHIPISQ
ncbi:MULTISPECIES: hypothetical protein [Acinetobacter]|uniref:hypothetical protein n=1 Tax=Acinetobacter TaxID=469 RepID=UPI001D0EAC40|nr:MULTISPECIES: hypothetical protein [Acinetobacter]